MASKSRSYPLTLYLRPHGTAELCNRHEDILWASDADDDFKEEFTDEFLDEEDFDEVLDWLYHNGIIKQNEFDHFDSEEWEMVVESLEGSTLEPDDDDEENEEFEDLTLEDENKGKNWDS